MHKAQISKVLRNEENWKSQHNYKELNCVALQICPDDQDDSDKVCDDICSMINTRCSDTVIDKARAGGNR